MVTVGVVVKPLPPLVTVNVPPVWVYAPVPVTADPLGPWKTLNAMLAENPPPPQHALMLAQNLLQPLLLTFVLAYTLLNKDLGRHHEPRAIDRCRRRSA